MNNVLTPSQKLCVPNYVPKSEFSRAKKAPSRVNRTGVKQASTSQAHRGKYEMHTWEVNIGRSWHSYCHLKNVFVPMVLTFPFEMEYDYTDGQNDCSSHTSSTVRHLIVCLAFLRCDDSQVGICTCSRPKEKQSMSNRTKTTAKKMLLWCNGSMIL